MEYVSVAKKAREWKLSDRTVRNYCAQGRVKGALLEGKTWRIPTKADKPKRKNAAYNRQSRLLEVLREEQKAHVHGGIYHKVQVELTYNTNRIEGSKLTHDQTRYIYETNTVDAKGAALNVDDIVETANHFCCIDLMITHAGAQLSEGFIKQLHATLKHGTADSRKDWFAVGEYKRLPNEVGGKETCAPEDVGAEMKRLLDEYHAKNSKSLEDIIDFHHRFETIHPFQDGNGRVGRLIMFKECLKYGIVPFIIQDDTKMFYYRGLKEWENEKGFLMDTCLAAQDAFKKYLDYFRIEHV